MTKAEFIQQAKAFPEGTMAVVSGPDVNEVTALLQDAMTEIESTTSKQVLVFNARDQIVYTQRFYIKNSLEARLWEFVAVTSEGAFVVLIANEFDRLDPDQNRNPQTVEIDTVLDLLRYKSIEQIHPGYSRHRTGPTPLGIRELYPHITKIYYFDTDLDDVIFIKNQTPDRP